MAEGDKARCQHISEEVRSCMLLTLVLNTAFSLQARSQIFLCVCGGGGGGQIGQILGPFMITRG